MQEWIETSEIIRNVRGSVDYGNLLNADDWRGMLKNKLSDPQVPQLIREISDNGFNVPIRIGKDMPNNWELGNGHHRLSVAILLGLEKVLITDNVGDSGIHGYIIAHRYDSGGSEILADMVDEAIDWTNWPNPTF